MRSAFFFCFTLWFASLGASCPKTADHVAASQDWLTKLRTFYLYPPHSDRPLSTIPNSGIGVHPCWGGEFDLTYLFTKYLGAELSLGTCRSTLIGKKILSDIRIGTAWLFPPTLTLQWRILPSSIAQPYLGAGINYTLFYQVRSKITHTSLSLSNSWGAALQAGMDLFFKGKWFVNLDAKYIWIRTDVQLSGAVPGSVYINISPWILGAGIGRKW